MVIKHDKMMVYLARFRGVRICMFPIYIYPIFITFINIIKYMDIKFKHKLHKIFYTNTLFHIDFEINLLFK